MPIYAYQCSSCEETGEINLPFLEFQKFKCVKCGSSVNQVYHAINYKINGYSYNNYYKGKSMYRDHVNKKFKEARQREEK
jgi:putative FmdB family regulatory protein